MNIICDSSFWNALYQKDSCNHSQARCYHMTSFNANGCSHPNRSRKRAIGLNLGPHELFLEDEKRAFPAAQGLF